MEQWMEYIFENASEFSVSDKVKDALSSDDDSSVSLGVMVPTETESVTIKAKSAVATLLLCLRNESKTKYQFGPDVNILGHEASSIAQTFYLPAVHCELRRKAFGKINFFLSSFVSCIRKIFFCCWAFGHSSS